MRRRQKSVAGSLKPVESPLTLATTTVSEYIQSQLLSQSSFLSFAARPCKEMHFRHFDDWLAYPKFFSREKTLTWIAPYGWNMSDSLFRTASCCSGLGIDGRLPTCKSMYVSSFSPALQGSADRAGWRSFTAPLSTSHDGTQEGIASLVNP